MCTRHACAKHRPQRSCQRSTAAPAAHLYAVLQAVGQALVHVVSVVRLKVGQHCEGREEKRGGGEGPEYGAEYLCDATLSGVSKWQAQLLCHEARGRSTLRLLVAVAGSVFRSGNCCRPPRSPAQVERTRARLVQAEQAEVERGHPHVAQQRGKCGGAAAGLWAGGRGQGQSVTKLSDMSGSLQHKQHLLQTAQQHAWSNIHRLNAGQASHLTLSEPLAPWPALCPAWCSATRPLRKANCCCGWGSSCASSACCCSGKQSSTSCGTGGVRCRVA